MCLFYHHVNLLSKHRTSILLLLFTLTQKLHLISAHVLVEFFTSDELTIEHLTLDWQGEFALYSVNNEVFYFILCHLCWASMALELYTFTPAHPLQRLFTNYMSASKQLRRIIMCCHFFTYGTNECVMESKLRAEVHFTWQLTFLNTISFLYNFAHFC